MQDTYNERLVINPATGNPKRGIYLERRLIDAGMSEMLEFASRF